MFTSENYLSFCKCSLLPGGYLRSDLIFKINWSAVFRWNTGWREQVREREKSSKISITSGSILSSHRSSKFCNSICRIKTVFKKCKMLWTGSTWCLWWHQSYHTGLFAQRECLPQWSAARTWRVTTHCSEDVPSYSSQLLSLHRDKNIAVTIISHQWSHENQMRRCDSRQGCLCLSPTSTKSRPSGTSHNSRQVLSKTPEGELSAGGKFCTGMTVTALVW